MALSIVKVFKADKWVEEKDAKVDGQDKFKPPYYQKQETSGGYQSGYQFGSSGSTGFVKPVCPPHTGTKALFEHDGITFFAAEKYKLAQTKNKNRLIINCTGSTVLEKPKEVENPVKGQPERLVWEVAKYVIPPAPPPFFGEELLIDWTDRGAPELGCQFWVDLLFEIKAAGYDEVVVCCIGSHGRTGTALCAIRLAAGLDKDTDSSVHWIRTNHCENAVESKEQIAYLDMMSYELYNWTPPEPPAEKK